jgi:hypothetical protein
MEGLRRKAMAQPFMVELTPELNKRLENIEKMLKELTKSDEPEPDREFLSTSQILAKYHIGRTKLRQWVEEGKVDMIGKPGERYQRFRIKRNDVNE